MSKAWCVEINKKMMVNVKLGNEIRRMRCPLCHVHRDKEKSQSMTGSE